MYEPNNYVFLLFSLLQEKNEQKLKKELKEMEKDKKNKEKHPIYFPVCYEKYIR